MILPISNSRQLKELGERAEKCSPRSALRHSLRAQGTGTVKTSNFRLTLFTSELKVLESIVLENFPE